VNDDRDMKTDPLATLDIQRLIEASAALVDHVRTALPTHLGLQQASELILRAVQRAASVTQRMRRPWSLHRVPVTFLVVALAILCGWRYIAFFRATPLKLALPNRDATALRALVRNARRVTVEVVAVRGSREAAEQVSRGEVDLAFVQGGIPVDPSLRRARLSSREVVLVFLRPGLASLDEAQRIMTSVEGEGSHAVLLDVFRVTNRPVPRLVHTWSDLTSTDEMPSALTDVDAVFVVKDPSDEQTRRGVHRLMQRGFRFAPLRLGAMALHLPYLAAAAFEPGWLLDSPSVPEAKMQGWTVDTWLVARDGLTPRLLAEATHLLRPSAPALTDEAVSVTASQASEVLQGVDAFLNILINIGLAFIGLLGLDVVAYRRHFHELNSLVSLLGQLQSNKDVLLVADDALRKENIVYLAVVSDLLGLISSVNSAYTQAHSALVSNSLSEVVHQRCNALKINIQLKLLQSAIRE
jgi:hypothetical protein